MTTRAFLLQFSYSFETVVLVQSEVPFLSFEFAHCCSAGAQPIISVQMKQVFLRHKNGGGKVYGNDALVTADTFLDRKSSVGDSAEVYHSTIIDSIVGDKSIIVGGRIEGSSLGGQTHVWDNPTITDCSLSNVFVYGDAVLVGFRLDAFVRVHAGRWVNPPRFERLSGPGLELTVSECVPGFGHIGCKCESYENWFRPGYRQMIGKRCGWTPEMVDFTYQKFQDWAV